MKNIFFFLLFFLVFETILSNNKFSKLFKKIKEKKSIKEPKIRKLQETDISVETGEGNSTSSNDISVEPSSVEYTGDKSSTGAETGSALAFDTEIAADKPVSEKGYQSGKKNAPIQFSKFHGFQGDKSSKKITFYILFLFLEKAIPYRIIFRLRVLYASRLRNLQATAQSVRSDCTITNESLVGNENYEKNVNFNCSANKTEGAEISSVALNTDIPMTLANKDGSKIEEIGFEDVNFNGNAADEATNIKEKAGAEIKEIETLTVTKYEISGQTLTLIGTLSTESLTLRRLDLADGQSIDMNMNTKVNGNTTTKTYPCKINTGSGQLVCDTSSSPIDTTPYKLHLSNGQSGSTFLNVEMQDKDDDKTTIKATSNEVKYTKSSSSGLSGGAIAGIVIACVAVLVAAAIAAIMLRKPSTTIDNSTTAVELRNDNL